MITKTIINITNNCIKKAGKVSDNSAKGLVEIIPYISSKLNHYL